MEKRTVKKGRHDYSGKLHRFTKLGWRVKTATVDFEIPAGAWFDPTDSGPLQRDGKDWNKIGGVSFVNPLKWRTWFKNSCTAMVAWRPSETEGKFEVCLYTNREDRSFVWSDVIEVEAGEEVTAKLFVFGATTVTAQFNRSRGADKFVWVDVNPRDIRGAFATEVGTWFGGNRPAPHAHTIYADTTW